MPPYCLVLFVGGVKLRIRFAGSIDYGTFSNSETVNYLKQEAGDVCKICFRDLNKGDQS